MTTARPLGAGPSSAEPSSAEPSSSTLRVARPAAAALPWPHGDAQGPVFAAPWQATAFALVVALHERGLFGWDEWAARLSAAIRDAQAVGDPDLGDTYWLHWLHALETLLLERGIAAPLALAGLREAWRTATEAAPHGAPVRLNAAMRRLGRLDAD